MVTTFNAPVSVTPSGSSRVMPGASPAGHSPRRVAARAGERVGQFVGGKRARGEGREKHGRSRADQGCPPHTIVMPWFFSGTERKIGRAHV